MVSMLGKPITNPSVPYVGPLGSSLSPGKFLRILGTVSSVGKQFFSNLQCGPTHFDDIALHISVRLNEGCIVIKCQQFGTWRDEQVYENTEVSRGKQFEILVICELTVFKIGINGQHLCEFSHKVPYERVSHIRIEGDIAVSQMSVEAQPLVTPPMNYMDNMNSAPPPYPGATAPQGYPPVGAPMPINNVPPYPLNSGISQPMMYPSQNMPVGTLLLPQQPPPTQPLPLGAINATSRTYQPAYGSRWYAGDRRKMYIASAVFGAIFIVFLIAFLIVFFTLFNKSSREFDEAKKRHEDFVKENFPNNRW